MGTLEEKRAYLKETKSLLYQYLADNGYAVTDSMTFRQAVELLKVSDELVCVFAADFSGDSPSAEQFYSWEGRDYSNAITDSLDNIECVDGVAKLTSVYDADKSRWIQQMMCTGGLFESDDFTCEFRAKFCGLPGSWNNVITYGTGTYWTNGTYSDGVRWPAGGEIDAFEQVGGYSETPNTMNTPTAHWGTGRNSGYPDTQLSRATNNVEFTTDEWHNFKFSLKNGNVKTWIDGELVGENDFSDCTVDNHYLCDYKPFLKPHAFYIDGSCASSNSEIDTSNAFTFEVSDFKVYQDENVECIALEIFPQMWERDTELVFPVGSVLYLDREYSPSNVSNKACTWESSDETVATVVQGYVKTLKTGNTTITAKCGNATASYALAVSATASIPCVKVRAEQDKYTVVAGENVDIGYYLYPNFATDAVALSTANENIATVDGTTVTGVSEGDVVITIACGKATYDITVSVAPAERAPFAEYSLTGIDTGAVDVVNTGTLGEALNISGGVSGTLTETLDLRNNKTMFYYKGVSPTMSKGWLLNGTNPSEMPSVQCQASNSNMIIRHGAGSGYKITYVDGDKYNIAIYNNGTNSSVFVNGEKVVTDGKINYTTTAFSYFGQTTLPMDYFAAYHGYEFTDDELIAMTAAE